MAKVLIGDDHPLFREALRVALGDACQGEQNSIVEAQDIDGIKSLAAANSDLDLILLDLKMPGVVGFSGLVDLRQSYPDVPIVIVSATEERGTIREAITFGAAGFIPKSLGRHEIAAAIQSVLDGEIFVPPHAQIEDEPSDDERERLEVAKRMSTLTPQQMRVLSLIAEGKPNKIIAYELDVAETTVKAHITAILRKLKVHSRTQAVLAAQTHFSKESIPM
ncbi:MAG: response regulator transcription factor [Pseudomonadota bacterium]